MLSASSWKERGVSTGLRERLRSAASALVRLNGNLEWYYDRWLLARRFYHQFGRRLNLSAPRTFNEKVCYKRLYDRRPLLAMAADKLRVRDYVAAQIGAKYLTELYQVCNSPNEIDYDQLPSQFVIKASHGTAMTFIARDATKARDPRVRTELASWLTRNLYSEQREWCYRDIPPRLMVEELLLENGAVPTDWKFYIFGGNAAYVDVHVGRYAQGAAAAGGSVFSGPVRVLTERGQRLVALLEGPNEELLELSQPA